MPYKLPEYEAMKAARQMAVEESRGFVTRILKGMKRLDEQSDQYYFSYLDGRLHKNGECTS